MDLGSPRPPSRCTIESCNRDPALTAHDLICKSIEFIIYVPPTTHSHGPRSTIRSICTVMIHDKRFNWDHDHVRRIHDYDGNETYLNI